MATKKLNDLRVSNAPIIPIIIGDTYEPTTLMIGRKLLILTGVPEQAFIELGENALCIKVVSLSTK